MVPSPVLRAQLLKAKSYLKVLSLSELEDIMKVLYIPSLVLLQLELGVP
jgi:hypothetical protein